MASFPPRRKVMLRALASLRGQVDRIFLSLNGYEAPPAALAGRRDVEVHLCDRDLKDAGKFRPEPAPDDVVFTVDDDIRYPPDYVRRTLDWAERIGFEDGVFGYQATSWMADLGEGRSGWTRRNFATGLDAPRKMDVLGTGTTCMLGRAQPPLADVEPCAGFVDIRFARWQGARGRRLWALPREAGWMADMLPRRLRTGSLFRTVYRDPPPAMRRELALLMSERTPGSERSWAALTGRCGD